MSSRSSTRSSGGVGGGRGTKRARNDDQQASASQQQPQFQRKDGCSPPTKQQPNQQQGRPQLLLATEELRKRTGKKYCDESELVALLLAQGLVRRVRTIAVEVRPLSGESFDIRVDLLLLIHRLRDNKNPALCDIVVGEVVVVAKLPQANTIFLAYALGGVVSGNGVSNKLELGFRGSGSVE